MYSDRRGYGQKPPRTKQNKRPSDPREQLREFVQRAFVRVFCTRSTKNRRGSAMCDVLSGDPGMCDKV